MIRFQLLLHSVIPALRHHMTFALLIPAFLISRHAIAQQTPYEMNGKNYSATYAECIDYYRKLDQQHAGIRMKTMGMTDAGEPLHLVMISADREFDPATWRQENKVIVLINNAIHAGEPDGIDASMLLARDAVQAIEQDSFPENVVLCIIPVYNIGGCLNRSPYYRVDQNGPDAFGSRGNSQNLDLNRDFIKCDSREARSFAAIFHWVQPDIFIDNHVTDGADYQHVMTLAPTQHNKLGGVMGTYLHKEFEPALYKAMETRNYPMIPYVNVWGKDARDGWNEFFDNPRYSSGYTALFNTFSFTFETHMLKPYAQRVDATYQLMQCMIDFASGHADTIHTLRRQMLTDQLQQREFALDWVCDETQYEEFPYKGYVYSTHPSKVSGLPVKFYDRSQPYSMQVKIRNTYKPSVSVQAPSAYLIPQGWWTVIELLQLNGVEMQRMEVDDSMEVEAYKISGYKSTDIPYEEHHPNRQIEVKTQVVKVKVRAGDYYIPAQQAAKRFLIETLEPQGSDSYFAWNFFDAILVQKEGYSDYAYEERAAEYLEAHPELQQLLQQKRESDTAFAHNASAQLNFVYNHSPYIEPWYNLYPVYRIGEALPADRMQQQGPARPREAVKEDE